MEQTDTPLSIQLKTWTDNPPEKEKVDLKSRIQRVERKSWNEIESPEVEVVE